MSIDRHSDTWTAIAARCKEEIDKGRDALEHAEDPQIRGRIKAFRDVLAMASPPPVRLNADDVRMREYSIP